MLYITHDIASARYFADEILVMYAGEIVERGPAEEITQHPAHPYTQLLVASAPDPDNLGSALRGGGRPGAAAASGRPAEAWTARPRRAARSTPGARSLMTAAAREDPALMQISATRAAACWHLDVPRPSSSRADGRWGHDDP